MRDDITSGKLYTLYEYNCPSTIQPYGVVSVVQYSTVIASAYTNDFRTGVMRRAKCICIHEALD